MTDSNFDLIQPVENLHSVHSLTPAEQQGQRKRKQKPPEQPAPSGQEPSKKTPEESTPDPDDAPHTIDYCA